jgi:hypothetical protein
LEELVTVLRLLRAAAASLADADGWDLDPVTEDLMVEHIGSWPSDLREDLLADLGQSSSFVGSLLFERVVEHARPSTRRRLWATGRATVAQAAAAYAAEVAPLVRATLVIHYDLGAEVTATELSSNTTYLEHEACGALIDIALAGGPARDRFPMSVWVKAVTASRMTLGTHEEEVLKGLVRSWADLAVAVANSQDLPADARLGALECPRVSPATVVDTLVSLTALATDPAAAARTGVTPVGLKQFLEHRPVMTAAELDATEQVARAWSLGDLLEDAVAARRAWELSEGEFIRRAQAAQSSAELLRVAEQVPAASWDEFTVAMLRAVVGTPMASVDVMREVMAHVTVGLSPAHWWHPTTDVFDDQGLLWHVLDLAETTDPAGWRFGAPVGQGWVEVLHGPRAVEFTAAAIAEPQYVHPTLWERCVPWSGDLEALARVVPVGLVLGIGTPALLLTAVRLVGAADPTGGLAGLLDSFKLDDGATLGEVLDAFATAAA